MFAASAKPAESSIGSASDRITAAPSRRGKHAPPEKTHCPMLKEQTGKYEGDEGLGHEESEFDRQLASYKAPQYVDFSHVVGFRDGQEDGPVAWSDFDDTYFGNLLEPESPLARSQRKRKHCGQPPAPKGAGLTEIPTENMLRQTAGAKTADSEQSQAAGCVGGGSDMAKDEPTPIKRLRSFMYSLHTRIFE